MHGWAPEVIGAIGTPHTSPEAYLEVFFTPSAASRRAGQEGLRRIYARTGTRSRRGRPARRSTTQSARGDPHHSLLQRLGAIDIPVFVANGDTDPLTVSRPRSRGSFGQKDFQLFRTGRVSPPAYVRARTPGDRTAARVEPNREARCCGVRSGCRADENSRAVSLAATNGSVTPRPARSAGRTRRAAGGKRGRPPRRESHANQDGEGGDERDDANAAGQVAAQPCADQGRTLVPLVNMPCRVHGAVALVNGRWFPQSCRSLPGSIGSGTSVSLRLILRTRDAPGRFLASALAGLTRVKSVIATWKRGWLVLTSQLGFN